MSKNVLVTGGCGFIGSHLVENLIKFGHKVTVLDNLPSEKKENLPSEVNLVTGDVKDAKLLRKLLENSETCFHLAAILPNQTNENNYDATRQTNLLATNSLFEIAASLKNPPSIIYASSSAVYGNNANLPLCETEIPKPLSNYGIDKLGCEYSAAIAKENYGLNTIGLRFFNIYGPRKNSRICFGVIPKFIDAAQNKKPITIFGDGSQTRDFIYIQDAVDAMIAAMNLENNKAEIINICSGVQTSINSLVDEIQKLTNSSSEVYFEKHHSNHHLSAGSTSKAQELLNWKAKIGLSEGLLKTSLGVKLALF